MADTWQITFSIGDARFKLSSVSIDIPDTTTLAQVQEFTLAMAAIIDNMTQGNIGNWNLLAPRELDFTGLKNQAGSTADNEEKGVFTFLTENGYNSRIAIPSFSDSDVVTGSDTIDQTDVDIAAFIAAMTAGIELTDTSVVQPCDYRGDDIITLVGSYERFSGSRKRR